MRRRAHQLLCCLAFFWASSSAAAPQRIASINLCTDQLLMALVEPQRIVSLSRLSQDEHAAYRRADPARVHINAALPEEILPLQTDLVLAGPFSNRRVAELLRSLGLRVETFELADSFDGMRDNLRRMGELLGESARVETLIAEMDARIEAATADLSADSPRLSAAVYLPRGYSSGEQSLQGEVLHAAGFDNAASRAGLSGYGSLPLEDLLFAQPDLLVTSDYAPGTASLADRHLQHPVLRRVTSERPMVRVPYKLWICAGPWIAEAVEQLAGARRALTAESAK
jgi:iron complex transport system substrate-binding protein